MDKFKLSCTLNGHEQDVRSVVSPFNETIISGLRDGTVRVWQEDEAKGWSTPAITGVLAFNSPDNSFVNSVTYVDNGNEPLVASGGKDCIIYLSDLNPEANVAGSMPEEYVKYQLVGHESNVCSLHHQGQYLISGSWDATSKVWDLESMSVKFNLTGHESSVWDAKVVDASKDIFLTCSADRTIRKWLGDREIWSIPGHGDVIRKLLILPGGKQFASCSNDCTIKIWDLETGRALQTLTGHDSFVYDLGILPNGDIVSSAEDRTVRVWRDGNVIQAITLPCISVWCLGVLPNGDFVVGGSDNKLRIFSRESSRIAPAEELKEFAESVQQSSIAEQSVDDLKKTDIPGYDALLQPGKQEGSTIMVKNPNGTIEAHQWSGGEWVKIGDVVGSAGNSGGKQEFDGKQWDYVFDVDIEDGAPPLKLPYNTNENTYAAAERFLAANELPATYTEDVVRFIMKNTGGVELGQQSSSSDNPYADKHPTPPPAQANTNLSVIPQRQFIFFKDFKSDQLIKGLTKFNEEQEAENKFANEEISQIKSNLSILNSKEALELITIYLPKIFNKWSEKSRLIGYDILRISVPRVTTADLLRSTDAAEIILNAVNSGLKVVNGSNLPLFMMLLKVLNNLVNNTLFIQLYITANDNGLVLYNEFFDELLVRLTKLITSVSKDSAALQNKHFSTTVTTLATFVYNLSVYQLQNTSLKSNPASAKPVLEFATEVGEILVESSSEAAYRLVIGYGNYKFSKATIAPPKWIATAKDLYVTKSNEKRFIDLASDIQKL